MSSEKKILLFTIILILYGIVILFSASSFIAYQNKNFNNDPYFFLKKQIFHIMLGVIALVFFRAFNYKYLKPASYIGIGIAIALLIIVLIAGPQINGARRWLKFAFITIQPSDIAELSIIMFLSALLSEIRKKSIKRIFISLSLILLSVLLIMIEPNISSAMILGVMIFILLYISDIDRKYIFILLGIIALAGIIAIPQYKHAMVRLSSFLNKNPDSVQLQSSILALGNGGILGEGIGLGKVKLLFIPEAYSDFIFSIIGEELGFLGSISIIFLYFVLFYEGLKVARRAYQPFGKFLAFAISFAIFFKALVHIAISVKLLPTTGLVLPFISYGGSSIIISMSLIGILLNIARHENSYAK